MQVFKNDLPPDFVCVLSAGKDPDLPNAVTGVAIIIHNDPLNPVELDKVESAETGRWVAVHIKKDDKASVRLMVIYAPPGHHTETKVSRKKLIQDIHKWNQKQKDYMVATDKILVMGDFNADLASSQQKARQFTSLLQTTNLQLLNTRQDGVRPHNN